MIFNIISQEGNVLMKKVENFIELSKNEIIELYLAEKSANENIIKQNQVLMEQNKELKSEVIRLEKIANYDILTTKDLKKPIYNRNYFETVFIAQNENKSFEMAVVDINKLGHINNNYGHLKGDEIIVECAQFLNKYGTVFRLGGDEFLLIFKNQIKKIEFVGYMKKHPDFDLFSFGIHKKNASETISDALGSGDKEMYKMKGYNTTKK